MQSKHLQFAPLVSLALFVIGITLVFTFTSPEKIVEHIGIENGYLFLFIISFIAGVSTFTSVPYQVVLITLAAGGLNPFLLGLTAAVGDMLGDTTSYFLGYYGRTLLPQNGQWIQMKIQTVADRHPRLLPLVFFLYGATAPISNDVLTIPFGIARYPFFYLMIPLGLGNIVYNTTLAYFGVQIFAFLGSLFS